MTRRPPRSKLTDPLFPYRTLFRSWRQTAAHAAGLAQKMQVLPAIEAETAHSFREHAQLAQRGGSAKSRIWRTTPRVAFTVECMAALVPQALPLHKPGRGPRHYLRLPPSPHSLRIDRKSVG